MLSEAAATGELADLAHVVLEQRVLFEEIVVRDAHGTFEKAGEMSQHAAFTATLRE